MSSCRMLRSCGCRTLAALQRRHYEVMYDVIAIYLEAGCTDPQIAAATAVIQQNRERGFRNHLVAIALQLRPGLIETALDRYLALVLPEIYRTLVIERRWSPADCQNWLSETLIQQLLTSAEPVAGQQNIGNDSP